MPRTNATTRLVGILERLADISRRLGSGTPVAPHLREAVGGATGMGPHLAYAKLIGLTERAIEEVAAYYDHPDLPDEDRAAACARATQPLIVVRDTLAANSAVSQVGVFAGFQFGELRLLAITVSQRIAEPQVAPEQLTQIRRIIDELRSVVGESTLPVPVRAYILAILADMERALSAYEVFGAEPVLAELGRLLGVAAAAHSQLSPIAQPAVWDKLSKLTSLISLLEWGALYGPPLLAGAVNLLPP